MKRYQVLAMIDGGWYDIVGESVEADDAARWLADWLKEFGEIRIREYEE